jgi:hypothetical protein
MLMSDGNHSSVGKRVLRSIFWFGGIVLAIVVLVSIGLAFMDSLHPDQILSVRNKVANFGQYFQFIRWALYVALYAFWRPVIGFISRSMDWDDVVLERGLKSRNSTIAFIILIEMIFIQGDKLLAVM